MTRCTAGDVDVIADLRGKTRRQTAKRDRELRQWIKHGVPDVMKRRSRESACALIDAHAHGRVFIDVGNVLNTGQVTNQPRDLVVETAVRVDRDGFTPIMFGDLPRPVLGLVEPYGQVLPMTVESCFRGDVSLALQALRLDPVCSRLSWERVRDLGLRLLGAHRKFVKHYL